MLDEEARRKDKDTSSDSKALLTESERGRQRNRSPQNREKSGTRSKSRGRPTCFYCGKPGHFQKNCRHFQKDKETDDTDSKRTLDRNDKDRRGPDQERATEIAASEEEFMLITQESEVNLVIDEMTWVVDSGGSFHLTPDRKCFSSYSAGDQGCVRMGNEGTYRIVVIRDVWLTTPTGCKLLLKDV